MKLLGSVAQEEGPRYVRQGWLRTDGARWAAYEPAVGTTDLIDTRDGRTISRPDPEGCARGLTAVGGGELLYACENPECPGREYICGTPREEYATARYVVEDIASGMQHPVAGETSLPNFSPQGGLGSLRQIGSQWAEGSVMGYRGGAVFFLNWHTGRLVREKEQPSAMEVEDLDSPALFQPLCKPLLRPANEAEIVQASVYVPFAYEPPFAVVGPQPEAESLKVPLELRRCGETREVGLSYGDGVQLGAHMVSWMGVPYTKGKQVAKDQFDKPYVVRLCKGEPAWHGPLYRLTGPSGQRMNFAGKTLVQHTSSMIFATVKQSDATIQVYAARLPSARAGC